MKKITTYLDFIAKCIFCYAGCGIWSGIGRVFFILLFQIIFKYTCNGVLTNLVIIFCHVVTIIISTMTVFLWSPEPRWVKNFRKDIVINYKAEKENKKEFKEKLKAEKLTKKLKINNRFEIMDL